MSFFENSGKARVNVVILMLVMVVAAFLAAGAPFYNAVTGGEGRLVDQPHSEKKNSLQFESLKFTTSTPALSSQPQTDTPPPSSLPVCEKYSNISDPNSCRCLEFPICKFLTGDECFLGPKYCTTLTCETARRNGHPSFQPAATDLCEQKLARGECKFQCIAKPVIYLYPEKTTSVNVALRIAGIITVSDPLYPEGGWKNVIAHPDGRLEYRNKTYQYLFYETAVPTPQAPSYGILTDKEHLEETLSYATTRYGLISHERKDFLGYWLPILEKIDKPYIFVTLLTPEQKETVDGVDVTPEPDTRIELIFQFEGRDTWEDVPSLPYPLYPPQRRGFTMVEWGGGIR